MKNNIFNPNPKSYPKNFMISLSLRKFHALNTKSFLGFSSIQSVRGMKDMVDE